MAEQATKKAAPAQEAPAREVPTDLITHLKSKAQELGGVTAKASYEIAEVEGRVSDLSSAITDLQARLETSEQELRMMRRARDEARAQLQFVADWLKKEESAE